MRMQPARVLKNRGRGNDSLPRKQQDSNRKGKSAHTITHHLTHVLQHDGCRKVYAPLGLFQESKNGYQEVYQVLGAIPGSPPADLLTACDFFVGTEEAAASDDSKETAAAGIGEDEATNKDDEAQEQGKVSAIEDPTPHQTQQEEGEGVDLFSIGTTTDRK